jgi:hypothetical protein
MTPTKVDKMRKSMFAYLGNVRGDHELKNTGIPFTFLQIAHAVLMHKTVAGTYHSAEARSPISLREFFICMVYCM